MGNNILLIEFEVDQINAQMTLNDIIYKGLHSKYYFTNFN